MVVGPSDHLLQADIIFVIEGTAINGAYLNDMKTNYVIPTLEYFSSGSIDERDYVAESTSMQYGMVVYHAADCLPSPSSNSYGPYSSPQKLLNILDRLELVGGKGESHANIAEGLATALQCFEDLQQRREPNLQKLQKHCILVCNSPPYMLPVMESPGFAGHTVEQLAALLQERGIHLSVLSPRKIPTLFKLYEKAGGDLQTSQTKNYAKDPRHLVLLNGYSLKERPLSPAAGLLPPLPQIGMQSLPSPVQQSIGSPQQPSTGVAPVAPPTARAQQPFQQGLLQQPQQPATQPPQAVPGQPTGAPQPGMANITRGFLPQQQPGQQPGQQPPGYHMPPNTINRTVPGGRWPPASMPPPQPRPPYIAAQQQQQPSQQQQQQQQAQAQQQAQSTGASGPSALIAQLTQPPTNLGPAGQPSLGGPFGNVNLMAQQQQQQQQQQTMNQQQRLQLPGLMGQGQAGSAIGMTPPNVMVGTSPGQPPVSSGGPVPQTTGGGVTSGNQPGQQGPGVQQSQPQNAQNQQNQQQQQQQQQQNQQQQQQQQNQQQQQQQQQPGQTGPAGPNQQVAQPGAANQQTQPGAVRERHTIWQGVLEWIEKAKNPSDPQKLTRHVPCHVSANSKDGEPDLKADSWPQKLIMQLMPKQLIGNIGGAYLKNSISVLFHPQNCEALESLTKVMSSGFAGCVHFTSAPSHSACNIKVLILLYTVEKRAYLGFIPNDQTAFVNRLRKVIQHQKNAQEMIRQQGQAGVGPQQGQLGAPGGAPAGGQGNNQGPSPGGILMSQTNQLALGGGQLTQNNPQGLAGGGVGALGPGPVTSQASPVPMQGLQGTHGPGASQQQQQQAQGQAAGLRGLQGLQGGPQGPSQPGQRPPYDHHLEAARQQNLAKIQQLQQTLEAAQQQELQYKSQLEIISHMKIQQLQANLELAQRQEMQYKAQMEQEQQKQQLRAHLQQQLNQRPQQLGPQPGQAGSSQPPQSGTPTQQQQQQQQQQRMMRPGLPNNNPGLRHLLQQQPYRQQMLNTMQGLGPRAGQQPPGGPQQQPQQFDDVSNLPESSFLF